ncbi:MAG: glycoside hydrolase family 2 TIM barrel-domain containing protein [Bacteroidia bacterium]|nr:glycoside hydrolase family 2 TIM barrel-domain containing protein [Bacteroidia bacterium]
MVNRFILSIISAIAFTACAIDDNFSTEVLFDDGWHFVLIDGELSESDSLSYISGVIPFAAKEVTLPHTPRIEPLVVNDQWQGTCFYFKGYEATKEDLQKRIALRFDAAMNIANVWINGKHAAMHMGGYLPFEVVISDYLQEGSNTIVVCLDNRDNDITGPVPLNILDYNTYGGLYRHVWLMKNDRIMITRPTEGYSDAGVVFRTINIYEDYAEVFVQTDIRNISPSERNMLLDIDIIDSDGLIISQCQIDTLIPANERATLARVIEVDDLHLWSTDSPNLYTLQVTLREGDEVLDVYRKRVGIRDIDIKDGNIYVNGNPLEIRGCNRYQEYPYVGFAISDKAQWRDAWLIKEAGYNLVRCWHYPPSESFIEACDAYGILVIDAIPGWQYFGGKAFEAHALQCVKDLIRRDRNHPSILAWELSIDGVTMPKSFLGAISTIRDREAPGTYTAGSSEVGYDICLNGYEGASDDKCVIADMPVMYDYNRGSTFDIDTCGVAYISRRLKNKRFKVATPGVFHYMLEDGPIMSTLKESKDILVHYADMVDVNGDVVGNIDSSIKWSVVGDACIVDPKCELVKETTIPFVDGKTFVVLERYGDYTISWECIDNEQVSY